MIDEAKAIETVVGWIDAFGDRLSPEAGREMMKSETKRMIAEGKIPLAGAISAARGGNVEVDLALRELVSERLRCGEAPEGELAAFAQEALLRSPTSAPPGRRVVDTYRRDVGIRMLVDRAQACWGLPRTRNRASRTPSACSLVAEALGRRRVNLTERQVERIVSADLQAKVSATIPPN